jgi:hypothetical protein
MKFNINVSYLAAALKIAPRDINAAGRRSYLVGVNFEFNSRTIIATDGHCLIALADAMDAPSDGVDEKGREIPGTLAPHAAVTVPYDACAEIVKDAKKCKVYSIECELVDGANISTLHWQAAGLKREYIVNTHEGNFPQWRQIVPKELALEPAQFDPRLLARMLEAFGLALNIKKGNASFALYSNHSAAICSTGHSNILGLVMPWRSGEPEKVPACLSVAHPVIPTLTEVATAAAA